MSPARRENSWEPEASSEISIPRSGREIPIAKRLPYKQQLRHALPLQRGALVDSAFGRLGNRDPSLRSGLRKSHVPFAICQLPCLELSINPVHLIHYGEQD